MSSSTPWRKTVGEMLLLSPVEVGDLSLSSSSRKRQITPLAEKMSPKKLAVITGPGAVSTVANSVALSTLQNPLRWFVKSDLAYIASRSSLYEATPNPLLQTAQVRNEVPRHIILPFDLRDEENALDDPKNVDLLFSIFPGTIAVGTDGWFVYIEQSTLPPKPWPLTVAGLPLYFQMEMGETPLPRAKPVHWSNGSIAEDRNGRDMEDWTPLFHIIKDHFESIGVSITEVIYFGSIVYIVLEHRGTDYKVLPRCAARIVCWYMFEDEMDRPSTPYARRIHDPALGNPDRSKYDTLQPGLCIASTHIPGTSGHYLSSTTGVLVKDRMGTKFMTAAAHSFPSECGTSVWHSSPDTGRDIGELIQEVSHTDIALIRLKGNETFSNVTFENEAMPNALQLTKFIATGTYKRHSIVCLDSPDSGYMEGSFMGQAFRTYPIDGGTPQRKWMSTIWLYLGEDTGLNLPQGICGSAIWDKDGNVLGFFQYAPTQGVMTKFCTGMSADELTERGYTLVDTSP
ncbi:hypothetical protein H2204_004985 [Knufia peltigerae]|uniref:Uncharacterized protein n=1 Tax=Knufia peltigerae TaxID=1002370 RepID=A0AA38Y6D6_9EURO|nr:hypothetical protein H2204_004985 [Knufia peltigerae]